LTGLDRVRPTGNFLIPGFLDLQRLRSFEGVTVDNTQGEWLTYRQAGERLGVSPEAVRSLARRRGWSRQTPNDIGGVARVLLPTGADRRSRPGATDSMTGVDRRSTGGRSTVDSSDDSQVDHPGDRVGELVVEIAGLRERIVDKDSVIADLRHRLDVADRRLDEAADERRRVDELRIALADAVAAERIASGHAAALRAEADARRSWRLLRRLREALRGRA
jgi:hypothetical protein